MHTLTRWATVVVLTAGVLAGCSTATSESETACGHWGETRTHLLMMSDEEMRAEAKTIRGLATEAEPDVNSAAGMWLMGLTQEFDELTLHGEAKLDEACGVTSSSSTTRSS